MVVSILLFVVFLWWANSSSIGSSAKRAEREGDIGRARYYTAKSGQIKAGLVGVVIGAIGGSFLGIVGFGSAIAGTVPVAIILGVWFYSSNAPSKR